VTLAPPERIPELETGILATRLFGESKYDPAILGTVTNPDGATVLIYDWEKLENIRAQDVIKTHKWIPDGEGDYTSPDGTPWTLASQELSTEIATAFPRLTRPPVVASLAFEDPDTYPDDAYLYDVNGTLWVAWAPEY
jgi:hypothetical protein